MLDKSTFFLASLKISAFLKTEKCEVIINNAVPPCWVISGRQEESMLPQVKARKVCHRWERQKPTHTRDLWVILEWVNVTDEETENFPILTGPKR